jgi:hypothetical protein
MVARFGTLAVATAALAAAAAGIYLLIGLEVLYIGEPVDGATNDILGFGLASGAAYLAVAAIALFVRRRWALIGAAAFVAMTIVVYVAAAGVRDPSFEIWGLLTKALQVVILGGLVGLVLRGRSGERAPAAGHAGHAA